MGGGIIDDDGEELRHRGSSWLEVDGTRLVLEDVCANHDLLEDMFSRAVKQLVPGSCTVATGLAGLAGLAGQSDKLCSTTLSIRMSKYCMWLT